MTDQQLLREYAASRSESAFEALVLRHIDLVHSAALRIVRNPHTAEDVTQAVFTALSKDAGRLSSHPVIAGWLHRTTRHLSANTIRTEARRRSREQQAIAMNEQAAPASDSEPFWSDIAPHLDAVLGELSDSDRNAVILRFFEKRSAKEIASQLGISAESAQKRVNRAVERLRESFARRGVTGAAGVLTVAIQNNAVQAAPPAMVVTITAGILAGSVTTTSTGLLMNLLQKMLIPSAAVVLSGTWLHQNHEAAQLRAEVTPALLQPIASTTGPAGLAETGDLAMPVRAEREDPAEAEAEEGGGFSVGAGVMVDGEWQGVDMDPELTALDNLGRPTTDAVEKLELSDDEIAALEAAVRRVREEASADFLERVKLTRSGKQEDGFHYIYHAPARPDRGQRFFDELLKSFAAAIGEKRAKRFRDAMEEDEFLGGMGKYDLELDFHGTSPGSIEGVKCLSREPGSDEEAGSRSSSLDHFEAHFGTVFEFPEEGAATYPKLPIRSLPQGQ